jgi:hypothetical protein
MNTQIGAEENALVPLETGGVSHEEQPGQATRQRHGNTRSYECDCALDELEHELRLK